MKRYNDPYVVPPLEPLGGTSPSRTHVMSMMNENTPLVNRFNPQGQTANSQGATANLPSMLHPQSQTHTQVTTGQSHTQVSTLPIATVKTGEFEPQRIPDFRNFSSVKKYKYTSPSGEKIAAGGILLFEETTQGKGVWVIEEIDMIKGPLYTDIGGRYNYDDGHIMATIVREFREETYNVHEISYRDLRNLPTSQHLYVNGYDGTPSYLSIIAHVNQFNISFNPKEVKEKRKEILIANPDVPGDWYKTIDLKFLLLKDIIGGRHKISKRLYAILKSLSPLNAGGQKLQNQEINAFFKDFRY